MRRPDVSHPLALAALLLPAVGVIAPHGAAPLLALAALAALVIDPTAIWAALRRLAIPIALLAAFLFWALLSTLWSITPRWSALEAGRLLLLSVAGFVLVAAAGAVDPTGRRRVGTSALAGVLVGMLLVAIELVGDFPIRRFLRGETGPVLLVTLDRGAQILVLATIAAAAMVRRLWLALCLGIVVAVALANLMSLTSVASFAAALAALALARWPRALVGAALALFVTLVVAMPTMLPSREAIGGFYQALPSIRGSLHHRLVIWNWSSDRIEERPVLGWGFDTSRAIPGGQEKAEAYMPLRPYGLDITGDVMPLHPHNAILQWWLELGLVGVLLATVFIGFVWLAAMPAGAYALALVAASMPPLLMSFGVWQWWWLSTLWIVAAVIRTAPRPASSA